MADAPIAARRPHAAWCSDGDELGGWTLCMGDVLCVVLPDVDGSGWTWEVESAAFGPYRDGVCDGATEAFLAAEDAAASEADDRNACSDCGWSGYGFHACAGRPGENEW